jgi:predicted aspartyl protease
MSILTLPLEPSGAIITVGFLVSSPRQAALKKAGLPVPPPVVVKCLVDTGASGTCVDPMVIQQLQIPPSGTVSIHTPSTGATPCICNQFDVGIGIIMDNGEVHLPGMIIPVIESDLKAQGIQALLGRDILEQAVLIYDGRRRLLTLAF